MSKHSRSLTAAFCLVTCFAGCSLWDNYVIPSTTTDFVAAGPMIANDTINVSPSVQLPLESVVWWGVYSAIAYRIIDPLAPNWEIRQASFPNNHVKMLLKMKRVYAGGAGEARQVFQNRAGDIMRQGGFDSYTIVEYSEGMDSSVLGSQRVAAGVIKLTRSDG